ncbi:MAG: hypothetical protein HQK65_17180 [Desulfamplus sp.]|nr:hypothetical protein [Desulfamplus sp.]
MKQDGTWEVYDEDIAALLATNNFGLDISNDSNRSGIPYSVGSIVSDGDGGVWVGTVNYYDGIGLAHLKENGTWDIYDENNSALPSNSILSLLYDGDGGIWVGTVNYYADNNIGLSHLKHDGTWELYDEQKSGFLANSIGSLLPDYYGGIWARMGDENDKLAHLKSDGQWDFFDIYNSGLPKNNEICSIISDSQSGIWVGAQSYYGEGGGISHMKSDGTWHVYNEENSCLPDNNVKALLTDGQGGLWVGTFDGGLAHLLLLGSPEQLIKPDSPEITITWFLNSSSLDYQNVKYVELQRSLSKGGVYETVLDSSDTPVRFHADYSECPKPRVDKCWVTVEGHTPATKQNLDGSTTKGYKLNTPITDPEWLEGLPRYYRLSAVIEEDGKFVRVANNSESTLVTSQVKEKPRVELTLDRNSIAMLPGKTAEITVFVSSLDLFKGDVVLDIKSDNGNSDFNGLNVGLEPANISLKSGETKPVLLKIDALSENSQIIKIIPKTQSGYFGKSASLNIQVGDGATPMIALSIAQTATRPRVMDSVTVSGNVIPVQAGQEVVISGSNIMEPAESATFTTDKNGYFQGTVTPIHAGLLTLTAKSNGITSNTAEIFILPARSNIALTSNINQATAKGDTLRVQGIITPVRFHGVNPNGTQTENDKTKVNLDIRYLDPADPEGGLQPQFVGGVDIDSNGVFYKDVVVPGDGFINVKASLPETSDYLSVNTKLVIPIGQPVGEGIIVVSESGSAEFQDISKSLGVYVYNTLINRNIPAERIKYLGLAEAPLPLTANSEADKTNLHDALTRWAVSMISNDDPYKTPLNLYLIGQIKDGVFRLNDSEILTAEELSQYLNEAEEIVKTNSKDNYSEYKGFPITIVLEGTQSGKWIETIAGKGRIVLTSSSDKPLDEGGYSGLGNLGETSFSRYFYQFINYGSDLEGSFAEANYEILRYYKHIQRPQMDSDGDGRATTEFDRYAASGKFIEYRPLGNLRPEIRAVNMTQMIRGAVKNDLWARAVDTENDIKGVFCSVTDPAGETTTIELEHTTGEMYRSTFDKYANKGVYHQVYYARDKAGNVSLPKEVLVNVINPVTASDSLPQAPRLTITVEANFVVISWESVPESTGYTLFYAPYPDADYIGEIDMGMQRIITFDGAGLAFYLAVKAYNGKGQSGFSNIGHFYLR